MKMYALINLPGSSNFEFFGPDSKAECQDWLTAQEKYHKENHGGLWTSTFFPARIVTNKEAESMRWRDGSKIINREGE
jgi:hypothetical protein